MFYNLEAFSTAMIYTTGSRMELIQKKYSEYMLWLYYNLPRDLNYYKKGWWSSKIGGILFHMKNFVRVFDKFNDDINNFELFFSKNYDTLSIQHQAFLLYSLSRIKAKKFNNILRFHNIDSFNYNIKLKDKNLVLNMVDKNNILTYKVTNINQKIKTAFYLYKNGKKVKVKWYKINNILRLNKCLLQEGFYKVRFFVIGELENSSSKNKFSDYFPEIYIRQKCK